MISLLDCFFIITSAIRQFFLQVFSLSNIFAIKKIVSSQKQPIQQRQRHADIIEIQQRKIDPFEHRAIARDCTCSINKLRLHILRLQLQQRIYILDIIGNYIMSEYIQAKNQKQRLERQIYEVQDEIKVANVERKLKKKMQNNLNQQIAKLKEELADLRIDKIQIQRIIQDIKKDIRKSDSNREDCQHLIKMFKQQIDAFYHKIEIIEESINEIQQRIRDKKSKILNLNQQMNEQAIEIKKMNGQIRNLQTQIYNLETRFRQARNQDHKNSISDKIQRRKSELRIKKEITDQAKEKKHQIKSQIDREILFIELKQIQLANRKTTMYDTNQIITDKQMDKNQIKRKYDKQVNTQGTLQELFLKTNNRLSQNVSNAMEKRKQVDTIKEKLKSIQPQIQQLEQNIFRKTRNLEKKEFEVKVLQEKIIQFKRKILDSRPSHQ